MRYRVYLEVQENMSDDVALGHDNITLALDNETPLLIRSYIILRSYAFSLRVSMLRENKGDTLCLPQMYRNRLACCNKAQPPPLVF